MSFYQSPTYKIVRAMHATGNRTGVIAQWKMLVEEWAMYVAGTDADAVKAMLPFWQTRPFYTAAELAPMFPALAVAIGITRRPPLPMSPARLANALDFAGLPKLVQPSGEIFYENPLTGFSAHYYIVEQIKRWTSQPVTQAEFEEIFQ